MSADSVKRQKKFSEKYHFQFPVLSDENKETLKAFEAWGKKKLYGREYDGIFRCTYIIDGDGIITHAFKKVSVKTHAQDILEKLV